MRGVFLGFFASLMSQPKSLQKAISARMRVHCALLNRVCYGEGESGTHLEYFKSGAMPWPAETSSWVYLPCRKYPFWDMAGGRRALCVPAGGGEAPSVVRGIL
jgi:hypothetical protein